MSYLSGKLNINYKGKDKWIIANTDKYLCQCGCGRYIKIMKHHFSQGIPKFIHGHNAKTEEHRKLSSEMRSKCIGPLHHMYKKDRSKIKGPRRWAYCFTKYQKKQVYIRNQGVCQNCGAFTIWNASTKDPLKTNIDHIVDIQFSGSNELSNGQVLCLICHKMKHSSKANGMNCWKPRTGNQQPSSRSEKVQRLLENSDILNNQETASRSKEMI